jgi:RNA 2',3'-cyclic 3'-phosphodiesterase
VDGHARLRLFAALVLPDDAVEALVSWQKRVLHGVGGVRIVPPSNLHITLAFLGSRPVADVEPVLAVLREAALRSPPPLLEPTAYRETRSVGMILLSDESGRATSLADQVGEGLERLKVYERERRAWLPHLTVLRFRSRPRLTPPLPEVAPVRPVEVALFRSVLRPGGAEYEILESVALGG